MMAALRDGVIHDGVIHDGVIHELRLILRARLPVSALLLLFVVTLAAVLAGRIEVAQQRRTIARVVQLEALDTAALAARMAPTPGGGAAAYNTWYATWDAPGPAAFLALGLRDVAPYTLRLRAAGLQAQLYDGENVNAEAALPGRFDVAFVVIYLLPLFAIALLHDLVSGERQSGRLRMLAAMPGSARMWRRRVGLRYALLLLAVAAPLLGVLVLSTDVEALPASLLALAVTAAYLAFWTGVVLLVATRAWQTVTNAVVLVGVWALFTLVLPALANGVVQRAIPVHQGVDLMLAQRDAVQGAWDIPRDDTMRAFYASHPAWRGSAPLAPGFEWKWLFAAHQLGDDSVAPRAAAYRAALLARQAWTDRIGWILPGVGAQAVLHRLAGTDLPAQLAYQDRIAAFHARLRLFYDGYLYTGRPFGAADFARRPVYQDHRPG